MNALVKLRSQFRVASKNITVLYEAVEAVEVATRIARINAKSICENS